MRDARLMAAIVAALTAWSTPSSAMDAYKWKFRPLVVFAPAPGDAGLARQRSQVNSFRPAFIDRKMVVVYVTGDSVSVELGPGPRQSAAALRARFGVGPDEFRVLLVGKDGGVKLSQASPIAAQPLFRTIDAMPMRQDETRRGR